MTKIDRQRIYLKYDKKCVYCGANLKTIKDMQVDHITPKWMFENSFVEGDMNSDSNLMPCCRTCNHYKRGDDLEGFRRKMKTLHERVCSHYIGKVALKYGIVVVNEFDGQFYFEKQQQTELLCEKFKNFIEEQKPLDGDLAKEMDNMLLNKIGKSHIKNKLEKNRNTYS